jgi:membrane-bound metal-dependent hydrolase YbcI (DUF457 family)
MMGITHATSGAAAWVAITGAMPIIGLGAYPLDPVGVLAGAAVAAGAALLPDADHHSATISHSVPILGRLVTGTIETLSGGHRRGAHSVIAVAIVAAAAWALTLVTFATDDRDAIAVGAGVGTAVLTCFGVKARDYVRSWTAAWAVGAVLGVVIAVVVPQQVAWFPLAVTIGFAAHLAGDFLTTGGIPGLLWPWVPRPPEQLRPVPVLNRMWLPSGRIALPLLGDTGSLREAVLGTVLALYCLAGFAYEGLRLVGLELVVGS